MDPIVGVDDLIIVDNRDALLICKKDQSQNVKEVVETLKAGESIFIKAGQKHRLENPGKTPLEIIEVQMGDYLEEDDIVRFDDEYGRS